MEEKVLIKGVFGGKLLSNILFVLAILSVVIFFAIDEDFILVGILCGVVLALFAFLLNIVLKKTQLIVTNKRVIARGAFGFRTDLPIEKITSVSMRCFGLIGCGSPSFKIRLYFCKNKTEIFDTIISESLQRDSKYQ